jgi:hypothetical protein
MLSDRDGKMIADIKIENQSILMKTMRIHVLQDKFLYNIIYNNKCSQYSLQEQDEYFEKIMIVNEVHIKGYRSFINESVEQNL